MKPLAVHNRMSSRRKDLNILQTDRPHVVCNPFGTTADVSRVFFVCADAGDGNELLEFLQVTILILIDV
ncbi:MAG: hypothetical protein HW412_2616 [Bacteroidetes bacterium]|nr:hypothetical protein [Bacteroidota bacterium]